MDLFSRLEHRVNLFAADDTNTYVFHSFVSGLQVHRVTSNHKTRVYGTDEKTADDQAYLQDEPFTLGYLRRYREDL